MSGITDPSEGDYRRRCVDLEAENSRLKARVAELEAKLASLETTVSAVVARSIDAKADAPRGRYKKSGRRAGHVGSARARPARIDARVELDQSSCPRCGGLLSEKPTGSYTRVVEDIVPAKVVTTEYVVKRRYCSCCGKQVSPPIPNVIGGGGNERFGLRLMLLVVSLKLLGNSYEKIGSLLKLLFGLDLTEGAMIHCVMAVAESFGPRYEEGAEERAHQGGEHPRRRDLVEDQGQEPLALGVPWEGGRWYTRWRNPGERTSQGRCSETIGGSSPATRGAPGTTSARSGSAASSTT